MKPRRRHSPARLPWAAPLAITALLAWICGPAMVARAAEAAPRGAPPGEAWLAPAPRFAEGDLPPASAAAPKANPKAITIDSANRAAVVQGWYTVYQPALQVAAGWTGSTSGCNPGTVAAAYQQATIDMVNYFRAMAGLPGNVTLNGTLEAKCQQAALMMLANNSLSHSPPTSWSCYTSGGAEAAGKSNLALGAAGPQAITLYMDDFGSGNTAVGHRRWVLYPPQAALGSGSAKLASGWGGSNDLWVIGTSGTRPATPQYVAWPPAGYVPYALLYDRWSLSRQGVDFSAATVTMRQGTAAIACSKLAVANGYGDNTLVWEPQGLPSSAPAHDTRYEVEVTGMKLSGTPLTYRYTVIAIDPAAAPPQSATGNGWPRYE